MTQLDEFIGTSLPNFYRCLVVPSEWHVGKAPRASQYGNLATLKDLLVGPRQPENDGFLNVTRQRPISQAHTFDPREKRTEFFRLERGNSQALLTFLNSVGLFQSAFGTEESEIVDFAAVRLDDTRFHKVTYLKEIEEKKLWDWREWLMSSMENKRDVGTADFQVRIERIADQPRVILTTLTFKDALLLTTKIDQVLKAKVRKCARPDCSVVFTVTTKHKRKYCRWECGHVMSVRRKRKGTRRS